MSTAHLFSWSESYNVGIQEVDEQHQVLVSLLDQLHEAIRERRGKAGSSQYAAWSEEVQTTMKKKKWRWKFW